MSRDNRLLAAAMLLWGLGEGLFMFSQPLYLRQLGADPVGIGTALALAAAATGLAHLPAGYLADHLGRKTVLVAGFGLGALAALLMFLAPNLALFVPALVLYNLTTFVLAPLSAYITEARGGQTVQRALTLVFAAFWAGNILSPAAGGWIGETFGLRYSFGVSLFLFAGSLGLMLLLHNQPVVPARAGAGRYAHLLRNQPFQRVLGLSLAALVCLQVGLPLMPNFLQEVRGLNVALIGVLGSVNAIGITTANVVFGRVRRPGIGLVIGLLATGLAMALLLAAQGLPFLVAAYLLRSGWNLAVGLTLAQVGRLVDPAEIGMAYGLLETTAAAAQTIGPLAAGALYAARPDLPFLLCLGLCVTALPFVWRLVPRQDAHSDLETSAAGQ